MACRFTPIGIALVAVAAMMVWAACGSSSSTPSPSPSPSTYTVGGTVSGLSGTVVLQNNAGDDLSLTADGSFTFSTALADAASYAVTVLTQPSGQTCTVTSGSGTIAAANVTGVTVTCVSPTVPTVTLTGTALSTGNSTTIATSGTTGISGATTSPLTMTFSTAMSNSTVSSGLSFQCPSGTSRTPTLATSDNTIYTITPTAALPQVSSCVLSLPATITDSSGTALAATSFTYTTGCGTNDDFSNSSTLSSCWTSSFGSASPTVSIASNVLNMTLSTDPGFMPADEHKVFGTDNVTATVSIPTFSGVIAGNYTCGMHIRAGGDGGMQTGIMINIAYSGGNLVVHTGPMDGSADYLSGSLGTGTSSSALSGTLFLRLTQSGTTLTPSYRVGSSGSFTSLTAVTASLGSSKNVALFVDSSGSGTVNCQFSNFTVTGATATGQYSN